MPAMSCHFCTDSAYTLDSHIIYRAVGTLLIPQTGLLQLGFQDSVVILKCAVRPYARINSVVVI